MEDFKHSTKSHPETKTTEVIIEFPESGKILTTTIKNREYPDETNALINGAIYKLVCQEYFKFLKEKVKEKLEEKNIEIVKLGRPKSYNSKHNLTEERKEYERKKALRHYYKKKLLTLQE
jgi:hypothetical protein